MWLDFLTGGLVFRTLLVQVGDEFLRRGGHRHHAFEDDVRGGHILVIDLVIGVVVGTNRRAGQGDPGEQPPSPRIRENFRAQRDVRCRFGRSALRSRGRGGVGAELHLAAENGLCAPGVHDQENKIGSLSADLETEAAAFERHHGGRAPGAVERFAGAAGHRPPAVTAAENERALQNRGIHDDAIGFVDQVLGNVVGNVHDLLNHEAAVFEPAVFFFVVAREARGCQSEGQQHRNQLFHSYHLNKNGYRVSNADRSGRPKQRVEGCLEALRLAFIPVRWREEPPQTFEYTCSPGTLPTGELWGECGNEFCQERFRCVCWRAAAGSARSDLRSKATASLREQRKTVGRSPPPRRRHGLRNARSGWCKRLRWTKASGVCWSRMRFPARCCTKRTPTNTLCPRRT